MEEKGELRTCPNDGRLCEEDRDCKECAMSDYF